MIKLYIGKSGAGKNLYAMKQLEFGAKLLVTYTTRPIREKEQDGVDYHFVDKETFFKLIEDNKLIEYRVYDTVFGDWYYGTPNFEKGVDYVGIATIDSAKSIIEHYGNEDLEIIYVTVDDEIREQRAKMRGSFNKEEWDRRVITDKNDFSFEKLKELENLLGKTITVMFNNNEIGNVRFSTLDESKEKL